MPNFVNAAITGKPATIYGDGLQSRDFTYIDNAVDANLQACDAPSGACGRAYNVACGRSATLLDILRILEHVTGKVIRPIHEPPRTGDVRHSLAAIEASRRDLAYDPRVDLEEGVRRTVSWFRA